MTYITLYHRIAIGPIETIAGGMRGYGITMSVKCTSWRRVWATRPNSELPGSRKDALLSNANETQLSINVRLNDVASRQPISVHYRHTVRCRQIESVVPALHTQHYPF